MFVSSFNHFIKSSVGGILPPVSTRRRVSSGFRRLRDDGESASAGYARRRCSLEGERIR